MIPSNYGNQNRFAESGSRPRTVETISRMIKGVNSGRMFGERILKGVGYDAWSSVEQHRDRWSQL